VGAAVGFVARVAVLLFEAVRTFLVLLNLQQLGILGD
jgi:hypothetical protein